MTSEAGAQADAAFEQALELFAQRRLEEASTLCGQILQSQPRHAHALNLSGVMALQKGQPELAAGLLGAAIEIDGRIPSAHCNRGNALCMLSRHEAAVACYEAAIALKADYAEAHYNLGSALRSLGRQREAILSFDAAIALRPDLAAAHYNRGNALRALDLHEEAIASYDKAIELQPNFPTAFRNRGNAHSDLGNHAAAAADYEHAIALDPDFIEAVSSLGDEWMHLQRFEDAARAYERATVLAPHSAEAHAHRGNALAECRDFSSALTSYERAIAINPQLRGIHGARMFVKMQACDWRDFEAELAHVGARIERGEPAAHPFCVLAMSGSAALQKQAAQAWVRVESPPSDALGALRRLAPRATIRVGYFSADFRNHPVARLTAELFEIHDRSRFEIIAFSFGPDTHDDMRKRLEGAFDCFIDLRDQSDRSAAALARELEIDIAVDLGGFTEHGRPGVFALRAAPLQVSYIGYLGTSAAPYMDYLLADAVLVPPTDREHYSEKLIYLPSYQVNDSQRRIAERVYSRQELGLPAAGFVFCCFNASYKIDPATFASWMRILARVHGSVLLLYAQSGQVEGNLRREAAARGIDAGRIVFAERVPFADYLARYQAMDLFLDTQPYNAGATASDALWAGLPVLTRLGTSFAGRIGASLLEALGLPELIVSTAQQYEDAAVDLAADPHRLAALRRRLMANRLTAALFDTRGFARSLEAAYVEIHRRYQADLPPVDVQVSRETAAARTLPGPAAT